MADNVTITTAADDIAGFYHQRVKISLGADGTAVDAIAGAGNVSTGVQRVTIADDDTNLAAIKTAVQLVDDPVATISATPLMRVAMFDAADTQITSFGGGTQYTENATDASITGTVAMMEVAADTIEPVQGTVADGLLVNLGTNNDITLATLPDTASSDLATIAGDTTSLDAKDLMLGTDFSSVLGATSLVLATQADALVNTVDTIQTSALSYVFNGTTWDRVREGGVAGSILVDGSGSTQPVSGTVTANLGTIADVATQTTLATIDTDTGNIATAAAAIQTAVEIMDDWDETNRAAVNLVASQVGVAGGTGADAANVLRVSLATDVALPAGTNGIGKLTANSGVDIGDVDVTSISAGTNLIGDVGLQPRASNGLTTKLMTSSDGSTALTNSAQAIKATAGLLYGYYIYNPNTAAIWVHVYNVAFGSVTVGTTNPQCTFVIPAESGANLMLPIGITYSTAMSAAATTDGGGNTAPSTALEAMFWYN